MVKGVIHLLLQASLSSRKAEWRCRWIIPQTTWNASRRSEITKKKRERIQQFTQDHLSNPTNINVVDQSIVIAICERQLSYSVCPNNEREEDTNPFVLVETLTASLRAVSDSYGQEEQFGGLTTISHLSEVEIAAKQRADQCIEHVITQIEHGDTPPPTLRTQLPSLLTLLRELNRLELTTFYSGDAEWGPRQLTSLFFQVSSAAQLSPAFMTIWVTWEQTGHWILYEPGSIGQKWQWIWKVK